MFYVDRLGSLIPSGVGLPLFLTFGNGEGNMKKIGIVMGSDSDLPIVQKAIDVLKEYGADYEVHIYSAHRTPEQAREFSRNARANGFAAIIAAAGKAAHLAGAIAANTTIPVIGLPIKSSTLDGLDALLSTVQMPSGIPVATVAIDGAANAALLALQILSVEEKEIAEKLDSARAKAAEAILLKDKKLQERLFWSSLCRRCRFRCVFRN